MLRFKQWAYNNNDNNDAEYARDNLKGIDAYIQSDSSHRHVATNNSKQQPTQSAIYNFTFCLCPD